MTDELKAVHDAACLYAEYRDDEALKSLLEAVMNLPYDQWPEGCGCVVTGTLTSISPIGVEEFQETYTYIDSLNIQTPFIVAEKP